MDTGLSPNNVPDQQTVNPSWIEAGYRDSTDVLTRPVNSDPLQETGVYSSEPFGDVSFTASNGFGATEFDYNEGGPVSEDSNMTNLECYHGDELT
jgi:hypothetical protein